MPEAVEITETTVTTPEWVANIKDDGLKTTLSKFESPEKLLETIGYKPPEVNWRDQVKDEDGKKFAADSTDINHLVKRAVDLRKQVSNAIIRPGKDAKPEQIAAYKKALGVPESPDDYPFPALPKEQLTDEVKASRKAWAEQFHKLNISKDAATTLFKTLDEEVKKVETAQVAADKAFAQSQDDKLKAEWKDDYDSNKTLANRAFKEIADRSGVNLEELIKIEMKDGRFLMDRADIVRLFATIGREMAEGTLGPALTDAERDTLDEQIGSLRKRIAEAQREGNSKLANKLYQDEQKLIAKQKGDQPIVGVGKAA